MILFLLGCKDTNLFGLVFNTNHHRLDAPPPSGWYLKTMKENSTLYDFLNTS